MSDIDASNDLVPNSSTGNQPDDDWTEAYEALVLEGFKVDDAVLLLKLLEQPDELREALEYFVDHGKEGDEPAT